MASTEMGVEGLEPSLSQENRILNPTRLPIPPHPLIWVNKS